MIKTKFKIGDHVHIIQSHKDGFRQGCWGEIVDISPRGGTLLIKGNHVTLPHPARKVEIIS
jgi:ribosomal protein L24